MLSREHLVLATSVPILILQLITYNILIKHSKFVPTFNLSIHYSVYSLPANDLAMTSWFLYCMTSYFQLETYTFVTHIVELIIILQSLMQPLT